MSRKILVVLICVLVSNIGLSQIYDENKIKDNIIVALEAINNNIKSGYGDSSYYSVKDYNNIYVYDRYKDYLDDRHSFRKPTLIDGELWDMVVPDNYSTIQEAVDKADPDNGYRIFVRSGIYHENVLIETDGVVLHGESKDNTVIDGRQKSDVISINCNYLNISGFTVRNGDSGFYLYESSGNLIQGNAIKENNAGVEVYNYSHANNITGNQIIDNSQDGIIINEFCTGNTIVANTISENNDFGISISNVCRANMVTSNEICANTVGINVSGISDGNYFYYNSLIINDLNAWDSSNNNWDNDAVGNYWDDYTGLDSNNDGIGDTPYIIEGGGNQDNYPLMIQPLEVQYFSVYNIKNNLNSIQSIISTFSYTESEIFVPDDYPSIQDAVNHSSNGDVIRVRAGVYNEHVVVDKQIMIKGDGSDITFLDGSGEDNHVFTIESDFVEISGFNISNCSVGFSGVRVYGNYATIFNNSIRDCGGGVELWLSKNNTIYENIIVNNLWGMYFHQSINCSVYSNHICFNKYGLELGLSKIKNEFCRNYICNNELNGILQLLCDVNIYKENIIARNGDIGLQFFSSTANIVFKNEIKESLDCISICKSNGNVFKENSLIGFWRVGIYFAFESNDNDIMGNEISMNDKILHNKYENFLRSAIYITFSHRNNISNNLIDRLWALHWLLAAGELSAIRLYLSNNNTISFNKITDIKAGLLGLNIIIFHDCSNNIISTNEINEVLGLNYVSCIALINRCNNNVIENNTIENIKSIDLGSGFWITGDISKNNTIKDNIINNIWGINGATGIGLNSGSDSTIKNNIITDIIGLISSSTGIYFCSINNYIVNNTINNISGLWQGDGITAFEASSCEISNNVIRNIVTKISRTVTSGIHIYLECKNITITGNDIKDISCSGFLRNTRTYYPSFYIAGILLDFNCENNLISCNTISHVDSEYIFAVGIYITFNCENNIVYHNTLINNSLNAGDICKNSWDYESEGNYYDDYYGQDNDGDGIGDTPYEIPGGNNVDRYPLIEPFDISITTCNIWFSDK